MTRGRFLAPFGLLLSVLALAPRAATLTAASQPPAATTAAPAYGPPHGTLFIAGGSTEGLPPLALIDRFIDLGGGVDGRFVIGPTAMGNFEGTGQVRVYVESQIIGPWLNRGLKHVRMLHTHDPKIADTSGKTTASMIRSSSKSPCRRP